MRRNETDVNRSGSALYAMGVHDIHGPHALSIHVRDALPPSGAPLASPERRLGRLGRLGTRFRIDLTDVTDERL